MYYRNLLYRQQFGLTRPQVDKLSRMMAEFSDQLDKALDEMPDRNLAGAIRYFMFNQHHDGGYHYSPMNYETNNAYHAPFILYAQLAFAGQYREAKSIKDLSRARKWLENFWLPRVAEEKKLLEEFKLENEKVN